MCPAGGPDDEARDADGAPPRADPASRPVGLVTGARAPRAPGELACLNVLPSPLGGYTRLDLAPRCVCSRLRGCLMGSPSAGMTRLACPSSHRARSCGICPAPRTADATSQGASRAQRGPPQRRRWLDIPDNRPARQGSGSEARIRPGRPRGGRGGLALWAGTGSTFLSGRRHIKAAYRAVGDIRAAC
jgi:hypothetical protein